MTASWLSFDSPGLLFAGGAMLVAGAIAAWKRKPAVHPLTRILGLVGLLLLVLAAGGLTWNRPATTEVVVMVDLSASTRTARYRDAGALQSRIGELLGDTPYRLICFSDRNTSSIRSGEALPELPGDRTVFAPPAAAAILLFSDARFDLPRAAPPTFIVADPNLDDVTDAGITHLEARGNEFAATVQVQGPPRVVALQGAATRPSERVEPGRTVLTRPIVPGATRALVSVARQDAWPENDALNLLLTPAARSQRWLVSTSRGAPSANWQVLRSLPDDAAVYLAPAVIVLDNLPASALSPRQQQRLDQYVRELGGTLVLGGGDRAFASGLYPNTVLDALSPLASSPPEPAIHWMLLADSSGSMSAAAGNTTRWSLASSAILGLLDALPPDDPVSIGSFAGELTWWKTGQPARQIAMAVPPSHIAPGGPTDLGPALEQIARQADGAIVTQLLVVSDTDTTIDDPEGLARRLAAKKIHLHVLAISDGKAIPALERIATVTGGSMRSEIDNPSRWAQHVRQLLQAAWTDRLIRDPATLRFTGDFAALGGRPVAPWNRTWLRPDATAIASTPRDNQDVPLAARWTRGGDVLACAFTPTDRELDELAARIARPPRDPRFTITWDAGSRLHVRVDGADAGTPLNGLTLTLEVAPDTAGPGRTPVPLQQTAPGRYEVSIDSPREPSFASVLKEKALLDRIAVPARYAAEFDALGNDRDAMRALARRTGGQVIDRFVTSGLDLPFPRRPLALAPWLCVAAALVLAGALARWRWG